MPPIFTVRASNAIVGHLTSPRPVAIFVGGTSGIGEAMARIFACHTEGNSNIVIVGRNKEAANRILSSLPSPTLGEDSGPPVSREFIQCDVTLMKNVHTATQEILSKYPKINYLVLSTGHLNMAGRDETSEGIDKKLALNYYGRWKFIHDLAPAIQKAKESGEEGAVMSVYAAGRGGEIDVGDLGLKKSFSLRNAANAASTYNDLMMEFYASQYPTIPFIHAAPGGVRTPILENSPSAVIRYSRFLAFIVFRPFTIAPEDCAEYMWNAVYSAKDKPRAWRIGSRGEDLGMTRYFGNEDQRRKLWEHTLEAVKSALETKA